MLPCPALPQADAGDLGTLMDNHVQVARLYAQCRDSKGRVVDQVRRYQGD